jgi:hypothetical protein
MKKEILTGTMLFLLLVVFVACNNDTNDTFTARIIDITDNGFVTVEPIENDYVTRLSNRTSFGMADLDDINISVGDIVSITFTGTILYTYPTLITPIRWMIVERYNQSTNTDVGNADTDRREFVLSPPLRSQPPLGDTVSMSVADINMN